MADIKIEEYRYFDFLHLVRKYIGKMQEMHTDGWNIDPAEAIIKYVEYELEMRGLMLERKKYYDAFHASKDRPGSKEFSNAVYSRYKEAGERIAVMRKTEDAWMNIIEDTFFVINNMIEIRKERMNMRSLYVMSKPLTRGSRLIGVLSEDNGEYQFKYKLGGSFPEFFLQLEEFPCADRIYENKDAKKFVDRIIPERTNKYIDYFLEEAGLREYNEWELLKIHGRRNMREDAYLYEELPEGAIIYEQVEAVI